MGEECGWGEREYIKGLIYKELSGVGRVTVNVQDTVKGGGRVIVDVQNTIKSAFDIFLFKETHVWLKDHLQDFLFIPSKIKK